MARKPRTKPKAEFHHITNRGASRSDIYRDPIDQNIFIDLLDRAYGKFDMRIHAYCLMGNHYPLLAQFPDRNLSQVMHWTGMCYATAFNRKYGTDGRLCKDRFHNVPVENDAYFMTVASYIHRNPKAFGIRDYSIYKASSYGIYVAERSKPEWMRTRLLLDLFNNDIESLREFTDDPSANILDFPNRDAS